MYLVSFLHVVHLVKFISAVLCYDSVSFLQVQAVAGLAADGRQIVARAKAEATNYERFTTF